MYLKGFSALVFIRVPTFFSRICKRWDGQDVERWVKYFGKRFGNLLGGCFFLFKRLIAGWPLLKGVC